MKLDEALSLLRKKGGEIVRPFNGGEKRIPAERINHVEFVAKEVICTDWSHVAPGVNKDHCEATLRNARLVIKRWLGKHPYLHLDPGGDNEATCPEDPACEMPDHCEGCLIADSENVVYEIDSILPKPDWGEHHYLIPDPDLATQTQEAEKCPVP